MELIRHQRQLHDAGELTHYGFAPVVKLGVGKFFRRDFIGIMCMYQRLKSIDQRIVGQHAHMLRNRCNLLIGKHHA